MHSKSPQYDGSVIGTSAVFLWEQKTVGVGSNVRMCILEAELYRRELLMSAISGPSSCPWHGANKLCDEEISLC